MANANCNKIIINGEVKIDLTGDTVSPSNLANGIIAHDKSGATIVGTDTRDSDTTDATAAASEILSGKTAYVRGSKVEGTMANIGEVSGVVSSKNEPYTVPQGYHDGSGKVSISDADKAKLISDNIREGITILGVEGSMSGSEDVKAQAKVATPSFTSQTISPDSPEYNYLSQVTVEPIPISEMDNEAGGVTVTVG